MNGRDMSYAAVTARKNEIMKASLGIDFSGGTLLVVRFEQPVNEDAVRRAIESIPGDKVIQPYGTAADNEWLIRLPLAGHEQGTNLEQGAQAVISGLQAANLGKFELRSQEVERHRKRFCSTDREQVDLLTESLVNKILHPIMGRVREWSDQGDLGALRIDTLYEAFELERPGRRDEE